MERPISAHEAAVVEWLLAHAAMGDVSAFCRKPVSELRVLPKTCTCGCTSLDFAPHSWGGASILADALAIYPDGQTAGLILWGRSDEIVLLEVYDCHPGANRRFPEIADLRSWNDRAAEQS